ncbi:hypothetical protein [Erwinia sp. SLM-02]|uniref:hypothetical protein n=1 Tax=Erwinia sp. SLM-02 TaxID=3020057 RepID=UPI003080B235
MGTLLMCVCCYGDDAGWLVPRPDGPHATLCVVPSLRSSACRTAKDGPSMARLCLSAASMRPNPGFLSSLSAADYPGGGPASLL